MLHLPGLNVASGSAEADFLNIVSMFGTGSVRATNYASTSNYQQMYNEAIEKSNPYWPRLRENKWVCFKMGTLPISKLGGSVGFPMIFRQPPVAQQMAWPMAIPRPSLLWPPTMRQYRPQG